MSNDKHDTDFRMVQMLQSGDENAFAELYENYAALLFGTIVRIVNDEKGSGEPASGLFLQSVAKYWTI